MKILLVAVLACMSTACSGESVGKLPELDVDAGRVAVAGLSSGAYMATQAHLAWPKVFSGAALIAGGPWGCAEGDLRTALTTCMGGDPAPDAAALAARAAQWSAAGKIGRLAELAGDQIYVLHGDNDQTVAAPVAEAAVDFYRALKAKNGELAELAVIWDGNRRFGHNLPVVAEGDNCTTSEPPYLGKCGFDAAGEVFSQLFGPPPEAAAKEANGSLRLFDQNALLGDIKDAFLADSGYLYLPEACVKGADCGVLVVFHGCQQNAVAVGDTFVQGAGFNRWADVYKVAVLYPQTRASFAPLNPKACWDWWGYSGPDYDQRSGVQQQWLLHALMALGVPVPATTPPH